MRAFPLVIVAASICLAALPAHAQSGRTATLPSRPAPATRDSDAPRGHPILDRHEGITVYVNGYPQLIRSCAVYFGEGLGPAPQMGTGSPPPGASGLPPAPGLQPVPGMAQTPGVQAVPGLAPSPGLSPVPAPSSSGGSSASSAPGMSSLEPLHSGWRTLGTVYYEGLCYVRDRAGTLRLIQF